MLCLHYKNIPDLLPNRISYKSTTMGLYPSVNCYIYAYVVLYLVSLVRCFSNWPGRTSLKFRLVHLALICLVNILHCIWSLGF